MEERKRRNFIFVQDMKHMDEEIAAEDAAAAETLKAAEAKLSTEAKLPLPDSDNLEAGVYKVTYSSLSSRGRISSWGEGRGISCMAVGKNITWKKVRGEAILSPI